MDTPHPKSLLRDNIRRTLRNLAPSHLAAASHALVATLRANPRLATPAPLIAFLPAPGEPDLTPFLLDRLAVQHPLALPRADWTSSAMDAVLVHNLSTDCEVSRYSILQPRADLPPLALASLDVVLVPGVAFDPTGARMGRGGGFYDRFLARVRQANPACLFAGVCFDEQLVDLVPTDAHDVRVGIILTPSRTLTV